MTRFARGKGSKASNEKVPENSTPWEVMKEQMVKVKEENEQAKLRHEAEEQRVANYQNFLKERKIQKRKATWCEFDDSKNNNNQSETIAKKIKKNTGKGLKSRVESTNETNISDSEKKNETNFNTSEYTQCKSDLRKPIPDICSSTEFTQKESKHKNKSNKKVSNNIILENSVVDVDKKERFTSQGSELNIANKSKYPMLNVNHNHNKKQKKDIPNRRKVINDKSFQLIINGKNIQLVRFDGFPIMKKDAERLEELKSSMIKKGIPKSEVQRTMKLERRRCEKALARLKKDVCYNCRKGGHNLSDCPDLKSKIPGVEAAEGVCFKCGSTEHRQFECKVQKEKQFRFATCFICKEPGHIARQCPDNPKGMYPNGGCCKLCGDVTHLRKDCPTVQDKKEETSMKLHTYDVSKNIEDIDQTKQNIDSKATSKKLKKIKF